MIVQNKELTSAELQTKWNNLHCLCVKIGRERNYNAIEHADFRNKTMVKWLVFVLKKAKEAYYDTEYTIMSDKDYDKYENYLKVLDPNNKFLIKVGN
jgi:hypothetical protein